MSENRRKILEAMLGSGQSDPVINTHDLAVMEGDPNAKFYEKYPPRELVPNPAAGMAVGGIAGGAVGAGGGVMAGIGSRLSSMLVPWGYLHGRPMPMRGAAGLGGLVGAGLGAVFGGLSEVAAPDHKTGEQRKAEMAELIQQAARQRLRGEMY